MLFDWNYISFNKCNDRYFELVQEKKKTKKKQIKTMHTLFFRHTLEVMVTKLNNMNPEITAVNIFVIYFARFNLHIEICLYIITVSDHMYLYVYNFQHAVKFHVKK